MLRSVFVLLTLISHAYGDSCMTYTFEEGYSDLFVNDWAVCSGGMLYWDLRRYEDIVLTSHNELSTKFISPFQNMSCVSSFMFPMRYGGKIEVNIFMEVDPNIDPMDIIHIWVNKYNANGEFDDVLEYTYKSAMDDSFVSGWHTLPITINGEGTGEFTGYLSMLGMAASSSTVLIDSFRYIPPGMDESDCIIYPLEPTTTTTEYESTTETTMPTTLPVSDDPNDSFWTPLRIKIAAAVLASILIITLICSICFCCCRSKPQVVVVVRS